MFSEANKRWGELLSEGLSSVSTRAKQAKGFIEEAIGQELGVSQATVQRWRHQGHVPDISKVTHLCKYCVDNGRVRDKWARSFLYQARYPEPDDVLRSLFPDLRQRVFLCYARDVEPDDVVALQIARDLSGERTVFFDQSLDKATEVKKALEAADFIVILVSAESLRSEVVLWELKIAHNLSQRSESPLIPLLIRLNYWEDFPDLLNRLETYGSTIWRGKQDTQIVVDQLKHTITTGTPLQHTVDINQLRTVTPPLTLLSPVPEDNAKTFADPYYIERKVDQDASKIIAGANVTLSIKGARQMGKSALLTRVCHEAQKQSKQVIRFDLQNLYPAMSNLDTFLRQLCLEISYRLDLEDRVHLFWQSPLVATSICTDYMRKHILPRIDTSLVIALDAVDTVFYTDFRDAFFGMLRSWHNSRAYKAIWCKLDLVLATSTEPSGFIENMHQSLFNVGDQIQLRDFSIEEVAELNCRYHNPFSTEQLDQLMALLNGHPYLIRRAFHHICTLNMSFSNLFEQAANENGPFGDHLRSLHRRLFNNTALPQCFYDVVHHGTPLDEHTVYQLEALGMVRRTGDKRIVPRCRLYANYFQEIGCG